MEWILPDVLINFKYNAEVFWPLKLQNHGVVIESYQKDELWTTQISLYFLAAQDFAGCQSPYFTKSNDWNY
jgi:hypothetical protein